MWREKVRLSGVVAYSLNEENGPRYAPSDSVITEGDHLYRTIDPWTIVSYF